jgi:glutathione S-transferase
MTIKLWGRPTSARTQKVLLALAELGFDYDLILASGTMGAAGHVAKGNQPFGIVDTDDYLAMNPNGTIPTLEIDGFVLWESNAIVQYLGMRFAPHAFYADTAEVFGSASRWMLWENNELIGPMHNYVKHTIRFPVAQRDPEVVAQSRAALIAAWAIVDAQLSTRQYIAADSWTMGDIPMTIRLHRWFLLNVPSPAFPNLQRYYDLVAARPSFAAIADPEMHLAG